MNAKNLLISLFLLTGALTAGAQGDSVRVEIKVIDSFTRETLRDATIAVYDSDSTTLLLDKFQLDYQNVNGITTKDCQWGKVPEREAYGVRAVPVHQTSSPEPSRITVWER